MAENLEPGFSLTGRVVDGKVVLDPFNVTASEPSEPDRGPDAGGTFVAVNAPFDPEAVETEWAGAELVEA